jgi:hypothetical protein
MHEQEFIRLSGEQYKLRMEIMCDQKKKRTAGQADRLIQFKRLAALHCISDAEVCMNLVSKQFTDLIDMASGNHPKYNDLDYLKELIADVQNYMDLLLAIEVERHEDEVEDDAV